MKIQQLNNGLIAVTLPPLPEAYHLYMPPPPDRPTQRIRGFSKRSRRRFNAYLQRTLFHPDSTAAFTLNFPPETSPQTAQRLYSKWARFVRAQYPTSYGFYSVEFKDGDKVHYHITLGFPLGEAAEMLESMPRLKERWRNHGKLAADAEVYGEPVRDLDGWLRYMAKHDRQRDVPECYAREMTRFWGVIGNPPERPSEDMPLSEEQLLRVRPEIANLVARQGRPRSEPFAQAIRYSWNPITIMLTPEESALFLAKLKARNNDEEVAGKN